MNKPIKVNIFIYYWCVFVFLFGFLDEVNAQSYAKEKYSRTIWSYLKTLSNFGPRYLGTKGYDKTLKLIRQVGDEFADEVLEHPFIFKRHNSEQIEMMNIEFIFHGNAG
ncbi:MAG: M28 family peptidase, partial [Nitrospinaceae bacterium]